MTAMENITGWCRGASVVALLGVLTGCGKPDSLPSPDQDAEPEVIIEPAVSSGADSEASVESDVPILAQALDGAEEFKAWLTDNPEGASFGEAGDVVDCGKIGAQLKESSYAISAWIRLDKITPAFADLNKISGGLQTIVGNGARSNHGYYHEGLPGYWFAVNGNKLVHIMSDNESSNIAKGRAITKGTVSIPSNSWTHVMVSVDRSDHSVAFFVNGEPDAVTGDCSWIKTQTSNVPFTIGAMTPEGKAPLNGRIARVRLFRGVMTAEAAKILYRQDRLP